MSKETETVSNDLGQLPEEAAGVMAATADVAGEKVSDARQSLGAAVEWSKEILDAIREKAAEGANATDQAVRGHLYQSLAIAFSAGALLGYLVWRRCSRNCD